MAPKPKDPDWVPLTPVVKGPPIRRTTRKLGDAAKQSVGTRTKPSKAKGMAAAALRVVQSPNILKNRRAMPKRKCSEKKGLDTLIRRNLMLSIFAEAALVQVDNSAEKIIDLQPPLKVYERRCKNRRALVSDNRHSFGAARSMDDCEMSSDVILETQVGVTAVDVGKPSIVDISEAEGNSSRVELDVVSITKLKENTFFLVDSEMVLHTQEEVGDLEKRGCFIDILKQRNGLANMSNKRRRMKRHNPKVIDPNTPKPNTPGLARNTKLKVSPTKRIPRRKLEFDGECSNTKEETQEVLNVRKKKRSKRLVASTSKLYTLIRLTRERLKGDGKEESLGTDDDGKSNQLLVRSTNIVVVSGKKKQKNRRKKELAQDEKPNVVVELDQPTDIVWKLFMESKWSEASEEEAIGNDEYMKSERKLFRERFERLNFRMGEVHGRREFKAWKGSVLDSIIGVYLTQNVSDRFSSSAFLNIRGKYQPLSLDEQNALYRRENQQEMLAEPSNSKSEQAEHPIENSNEYISDASKKKTKRKKRVREVVDWNVLRKQYSQGLSGERTERNADSVNWQAVSQASEEELASVIRDRGMNNRLANRIKGFLDRMVKDHGNLDLEWLRYVPPLKAKDFLMSVFGFALKSTECVRLLALHFPAFPVDTNAGRFFVRMGWVPLKPLPEGVQFHLLNQYPELRSIQKYMWPRLSNNSHPFLYESHCQGITIAKSFCTKTKPNCNECPMRDECKHFASAHASAKLRLKGSRPKKCGDPSAMSSQEDSMLTIFDKGGGDSSMSNQEAPSVTNAFGNESRDCYTFRHSEPIIEFPPSPVAEPVPTEPLGGDIEDIECKPPMEPFGEDIEDIRCKTEIPPGGLNGREFSKNLPSYVSEDDLKVVVAINHELELGSIPTRKQKIAIELRTVHLVLINVNLMTPFLTFLRYGEQNNMDINKMGIIQLQNDETAPCEASTMCMSGEVVRYDKYGTVKGTILVPCLTANRGAFPLNGTYFQPHEVFADHESSRRPIDVPREWIWNLRRRIMYCGTSLASICKGMKNIEVRILFNLSVICVRGFDKKTRSTRMLSNRFHFCKSRPANKCQ